MLFSKQRVINMPISAKEGISGVLEIQQDRWAESVGAKVNISHPSTGEMSLELINPQGKSVILRHPTKAPGINLQKTFGRDKTAALAGGKAMGKWKIKVVDGDQRLEGIFIDESLSFKMADAAHSEIFILDNTTTSSAQFCHQEGRVSSASIKLHISHGFAGDLQVELTSPSGKSVMHHDRQSWAHKAIEATYGPDRLAAFVGESAKGAWSLKMKDMNKKDIGQLVSWRLNLQTGSTKPKADDLTTIEGIGPKIADLLNEGGIYTFAELAAAQQDRLQKMLDDAGPKFQMAKPASWTKRAEMAAKGDWDALIQCRMSSPAAYNQ